VLEKDLNADFAARYPKGSRYHMVGIACPVAACLAYEIITDKLYSKEGGAHLLAVAFASEQRTLGCVSKHHVPCLRLAATLTLLSSFVRITLSNASMVRSTPFSRSTPTRTFTFPRGPTLTLSCNPW
jgi:hypothetical protein